MEFRCLRAATYFAHGGKVGKTPPGTAPMSTTVLIVAFPRTPFYGGPIRRAFRLSQRRGWFSRLVSLLLPLPLRVRSPLGVSSIGGKRAFLGGGAQVWLRETRAATWGRPYGQIGTFWGRQMRTPAPTAHPKTLLLFRRADVLIGRFRAAQCAAPTAENGSGALAHQRQARLWSRTRCNFPQSQAPVGRWEFRLLLRFCAPELF